MIGLTIDFKYRVIEFRYSRNKAINIQFYSKAYCGAIVSIDEAYFDDGSVTHARVLLTIGN